MAYVQTIFDKNFLEYASYVIKDRAIPHLDDGLKPVQRRILHSLFEMDDGKFHKVANIVGHCMKYHPHGDASIYEALVVVANKGFFIDTQGNFGNIFTGDPASAARYIECRALPFAKEVLFRPDITKFDASYDGRNQEPVVFPAKIPVVLLMGAEGIAVGMSTRIMPHNFVEVLQALQSALKGESFQLFPDFPTSGIMDASGYADGLGKVLVRARLDTSDPKRIVIRELPFGSTTESLIESIENASRRGKLKIAGIQDFTTENVEIEIQLARGVYTQDVVDALYAFTDCEQSISANLLVISKENKPVIMTATEVINYHAKQLQSILKMELDLDLKNLLDKLHARTLERIFIEERIYKKIEEMATAELVVEAVKIGFVPFAKEIKREVSDDDVERLLKIPIRRISLYDINRAKKEIAQIEADIKIVKKYLQNLVGFALDYVDGILAREGKKWPRKTEVTRFDKVDVREAAVRNLTLRYDSESGYLGHVLAPATSDGKGATSLFAVSEFDRVVVLKADASWMVVPLPSKLYLGKGMLACFLADKDEAPKHILTFIFRNEAGEFYIKRTRIEAWIMEKIYPLLPEKTKLVAFTESQTAILRLHYAKNVKLRVTQEDFAVADYLVKGTSAGGVRLTQKPVIKFEWKKA